MRDKISISRVALLHPKRRDEVELIITNAENKLINVYWVRRLVLNAQIQCVV